MLAETNYVSLKGRVSNKKPIQVYYTKKSHKPFSFITLANHVYNNGRAVKTTFVNCKAWGQHAFNLTQYHKGDKLFVKGHLGKTYSQTQKGEYVQVLVPILTNSNYAKKHVSGQAVQRQQGNRPYPQNNGNYPQNRGNYPQNQNNGQPNNPFQNRRPQQRPNNAPANDRGGKVEVDPSQKKSAEQLGQQPANKKPTVSPSASGKTQNNKASGGMSDDDFESLMKQS